MKLVDLKLSHSDGDAVIAGRFLRHGASREETLLISVPEQHHDMLSDSRDVFLPVLMLPCMVTGEPLDLGGEVSAQLLDQVPAIQEIYLAWFSNFKPVEVIASRSKTVRTRGPATGTFFSAGADSFHTLREAVNGNVRGVDQLSHLLFVRTTAGRESRGFGQPLVLDEANDSSGLERELDQVAKATNTTLVRVDTNVQALFPDFNWSLYHHGAALASIGLALSKKLGKQIISSGWSYRDVHPWGSHPFTDPLWSTEYIQFLHYGNHVTRAEKLAEVVALDELALKHLRVCIHNSSLTNCGLCYKCLRTMIPLDMVGKLAAATTFPSTMPDDLSKAFAEGQELHEDDPLFRLASKLGHNEYAEKIKSLIDKRNRRRSLKRFMEASPALSRIVEPISRVRRRLKH